MIVSNVDTIRINKLL